MNKSVLINKSNIINRCSLFLNQKIIVNVFNKWTTLIGLQVF